MRIYAYLRASTKEQDASRAREPLADFAKEQGFKVSSWFVENVSGASLKRPELFRLLEVAEKGDILLVEQIDRISRLNLDDWQALKKSITDKGLRVVSLDLPTSHQFLKTDTKDFTGRMLLALNDMMLDVLAAVGREDYENRRRRQAEGVQRAKAQGKYKGRPVDEKKHKHIRRLLISKTPWRDIESLVPCSAQTIARVKKEMKNNE